MIDWGDGSVIESVQLMGTGKQEISHKYSEKKRYTIKIDGNIPRIVFSGDTSFNFDSMATDNQKQLIAVNNWGSSRWTSLDRMFAGCEKLTSVTGIPEFGDVTSMVSMFVNCKALKNLALASKSNTSILTTMAAMFSDCSELTSITFSPKFTTTEVTDMSEMFFGCGKLATLNLSSFDTGMVTTMNSMFSGCNALTLITFSQNFKTTQVTNMGGMFVDCVNLRSLDLSTWDFSAVTEAANMLDNSGMTIANYDKLLVQLGTVPIKNPKAPLGAANLQYSNQGAHNTATIRAWIITGDIRVPPP